MIILVTFFVGIILLFFIILFIVYYYTVHAPSISNIYKGIWKKTVIPPYFFQIWISKNNKIPKGIRENFEKIKKDNLDFECQLFNSQDCEDFLKKHYKKNVLDAYKRIIPGAFKADLMRYCILYKNGGIYLDAKLKPINGFKLKNVLDKEYFVRDFKTTGGGVCNGFIVCMPGNKKLLQAIKEIVKNVNNRFYGESSLEPTGPLLLKKFFTGKEMELFDFEYTINPNSVENGEHVLIISRERENVELAILEKDVGLVIEQSSNREEKNYGDLWNDQNIYKFEAFTGKIVTH